jgi:hypothetical protein
LSKLSKLDAKPCQLPIANSFFIFRKTGEKMALAGRQNQLPPLIASVL